jgi:hypothetical protein
MAFITRDVSALAIKRGKKDAITVIEHTWRKLARLMFM